MKRIAFTTYAERPALTDDDRVAADELERRGVEVVAAPWGDPAVRWRDMDAVVLRSCWDYHLRSAEFLGWISALERDGVVVWNPPAVVRWNFEKTYLRDLYAMGVAIIPTVWVEREEGFSLPALLAREGWRRAVVKPTISLSAYETWVTSPERAAADEPAVRRMLARGGVMVQRFVDEIVSGGEWSLVFFGGVYSHTTLKRAATGDFRVQSEYGGSKTDVQPPEWMLAEASRAVAAATDAFGPLLYARVDGVAADGRLLVMELELIDPELYFLLRPDAAARFAEVVIHGLRTTPHKV
jgi:glutathione synthase/RimK-type ligase-like ATP-grasp enzyme